MPHPRQRLGAAGERAAAAWYRRNGYQVVAQNWRCRDGELDLVLAQGRRLVFCEVKTRSSDRFGTPAEAVTWKKQQQVRRVAARFLDDPPFVFRGLRFDVAVVDRRGQVQVIEGAF